MALFVGKDTTPNKFINSVLQIWIRSCKELQKLAKSLQEAPPSLTRIQILVGSTVIWCCTRNAFYSLVLIDLIYKNQSAC